MIKAFLIFLFLLPSFLNAQKTFLHDAVMNGDYYTIKNILYLKDYPVGLQIKRLHLFGFINKDTKRTELYQMINVPKEKIDSFLNLINSRYLKEDENDIIMEGWTVYEFASGLSEYKESVGDFSWARHYKSIADLLEPYQIKN
jgi:hypothetical protein